MVQLVYICCKSSASAAPISHGLPVALRTPITFCVHLVDVYPTVSPKRTALVKQWSDFSPNALDHQCVLAFIF